MWPNAGQGPSRAQNTQADAVWLCTAEERGGLECTYQKIYIDTYNDIYTNIARQRHQYVHLEKEIHRKY